jgi:hypothetical protein
MVLRLLHAIINNTVGTFLQIRLYYTKENDSINKLQEFQVLLLFRMFKTAKYDRDSDLFNAQ